MNKVQIVILIIFGVMTFVGLISMAIDKHKAIIGAWRIPEATLFLIAFLLGGVGSTIGMFAFRHKTKHTQFKIGLPLLALLSVATVLFLLIFLR